MKIGFVSLGCPKNLVDSEVMLGLADQAGHTITPNPAEADVLVVNTCAFIDSAKQESVDAILEMAEFRRTGACTRLVVTGCLAERYRHDLRAEIPEIDALLGTGEVPRIVEALAGTGPGTLPTSRTKGAGAEPLKLLRRANGTVQPVSLDRRPPAASRRWGIQSRTPGAENPSPRSGSPFVLGECKDERRGRSPRAGPAPTADTGLPTYIYDAETPRMLTTPRHFAYVKVAEGCDYTCAFCIIPTLRGHYRSRPADSIVREARALAERGVREVILISQDTTFYGVDRGQRGALAGLLRELDGIDGLAWIRLLYLYPTTIGDDVLAAMTECTKVCRYVDLPLQHGADSVLRRMKRPGTRRSYVQLIDRIRDRVPGVTLRTSLIVGFPGETAEEFDELCAFVRDARFDHLGVFTYSHEEGTSAYALADDVPAAVKRRRRNRLMGLQKRLVTQAQRTRTGERIRVLIDGPSGEHPFVLTGRLEGQAPEIDPIVYLTDCDLSQYRPGDFTDAVVVGAEAYDLVAHPLP